MNESLRKRIERLRDKINDQLETVRNRILSYKESDDFENAMKADIKRMSLLSFLEEINNTLK